MARLITRQSLKNAIGRFGIFPILEILEDILLFQKKHKLTREEVPFRYLSYASGGSPEVQNFQKLWNRRVLILQSLFSEDSRVIDRVNDLASILEPSLKEIGVSELAKVPLQTPKEAGVTPRGDFVKKV